MDVIIEQKVNVCIIETDESKVIRVNYFLNSARFRCNKSVRRINVEV